MGCIFRPEALSWEDIDGGRGEMTMEAIRNFISEYCYDLAVIKPRELPNGLTYIGTIHKLGLDLYQYNEWYLDNWTNPNAPAQKPLVPDGTLALLSTEAEYSIYRELG